MATNLLPVKRAPSCSVLWFNFTSIVSPTQLQTGHLFNLTHEMKDRIFRFLLDDLAAMESLSSTCRPFRQLYYGIRFRHLRIGQQRRTPEFCQGFYELLQRSPDVGRSVQILTLHLDNGASWFRERAFTRILEALPELKELHIRGSATSPFTWPSLPVRVLDVLTGLLSMPLHSFSISNISDLPASQLRHLGSAYHCEFENLHFLPTTTPLCPLCHIPLRGKLVATRERLIFSGNSKTMMRFALGPSFPYRVPIVEQVEFSQGYDSHGASRLLETCGSSLRELQIDLRDEPISLSQLDVLETLVLNISLSPDVSQLEEASEMISEMVDSCETVGGQARVLAIQTLLLKINLTDARRMLKNTVQCRGLWTQLEDALSSPAFKRVLVQCCTLASEEEKEDNDEDMAIDVESPSARLMEDLFPSYRQTADPSIWVR